MSAKSYWLRVHRRACVETRLWIRDHRAMAMMNAFFSIGSIIALWLFVGGDAATEELVAKISITAALLFLLAWSYLSRVASIPARIDEVKNRQLSSMATRIAELTDIPEPLPFIDFVDIAKQDFGWTFDETTNHYSDLTDAVRHAARRGEIVLEGRFGCWGQPEARKDWYIPKKIPADHFEKGIVSANRMFTEPERNYDIHTWEVGLASSEWYRDIQFADRAMAIAWLGKHAERWKGRHNDAAKLKQQKHEEWVVEMKRRDPNFVEDDGSEFGRPVEEEGKE